MLKWLRKYNTYILVVGGCLLMVAFLLGNSLQELGKRGVLGGTMLRVGDRKIGYEEYGKADREHALLAAMLGRGALEAVGGGENTNHWIMLVQEATEAGYVGGVGDGSEFITELGDQIGRMQVFGDPRMQAFLLSNPEMGESFAKQQGAQMSQRLASLADKPPAEYGVTRDQVLKALAKLRGVVRMQGAYGLIPRYSDRRLTVGAKSLNDSAGVRYALVPAERAMEGVGEPTDADLRAHYEKYKDVRPADGEFGVGYKMPARVKLAWLTVSRALVESAVTPDPVEVRKRFLAKFPSGTPGEGQNAQDETRRIEAEVRLERANRVMQSVEGAVRHEIDRQVRRLESDREYKAVPAGWSADLGAVREAVPAAVEREQGVRVVAPRLTVRDGWMDASELAALEGIGRAVLTRGSREIGFPDLALSVREIAGVNDFVLQSRVPGTEAVRDKEGNAYFFVVLDARKESSPDSIDEVRDRAARDWRRIQAYQRLKPQAEGLRMAAVAGGLEAVAAPPGGGEVVPVKDATVTRERLGPDRALDQKEVRDAVMHAADALDPLKDASGQPADARTVAVPVDRALGVFVGQVSRVVPTTLERYRQQNNRMQMQLGGAELKAPDTNPFSLDAMERRLGVKYEDSRLGKRDKDKAKREQPAR